MDNSITGGLLGATILKKWEDQTDAERVETLRNELREMRYVISRVARLEDSQRMMQNHEHGTDGKPMLSAKEVQNSSSGYLGGAYTLDRLA